MGLLDLIFGRLVRLDGPTIPFEDLPDPGATRQAPVPPAQPPATTPGGGRAAATPPGRAPEPRTPTSPHEGHESATSAGRDNLDDNWPPGHGRHANNCRFLDDPRHRCLNACGDPIRPGQDCWHSARIETLRSFAEAHPRLAETLGVPR